MICVNSVSVYPSSITLKVGNWYYNAYAEVCPPSAHCKEVQWHSDNPSIASVNASSGYIRANAVGITKIYATATDGSDCSDYLTVTVKNSVPVTSVTLNRSSLSLEEGQCASLSATVYPSNATNKNVTWTSSNKRVATVSGGIVTAISAGSAIITATAADGSGKSASCTVYVTGDVLVSSITLSPSNITLSVGGSTFLTANVCPTNATNDSVTWSTGNPCVATVNPNSGLVTAQGAGTATIYATAQDGSGKSGRCTVTVKGPVYAECIKIKNENPVMYKGDFALMKATVYPAQAASGKVSWKSSNSQIAYIDSKSGCIEAKAAGRVTISAHMEDGSGLSDCCTVIVKQTSHSPEEETPKSTVAGSTFADPVDVYSGAHILKNTVMSLFGGQSLKFTVCYNSTKLAQGCLGLGWYHNFEKRVEIDGCEARVYSSPSVYSTYVSDACSSSYLCTAANKNGYVLTEDCCADYPYIIDCNSERTEYYNTNGKLAKIVDRQGFETTITYTNSLITITDAVSQKKIYLELNSKGKVIRVYDDASRQAVLTYNGNLLVGICDVNGNSISYTYDSDNRIKSGTDSKNICYFTNTYDEYGRVLTQKDGVTGSSASTFVYKTNGTRVTTDRNGKTSTRVFNGDGLLVKHTDENGNVKTYEYDDRYNVIKETDANGNSVVRVYNSFNKPTEITDKNGNTTHISYDEHGNIIKISYPQANGIIPEETFSYNGRNQITRHTDLRGTVTVYEYDASSMPASKKCGARNAVRYSYQNGLLASETDANGNTTQFGYNTIGQMITRTDAENNVTRYEYDACGNLLKLTDANGKTVIYTYDGNHQKTSVTDANGNTTSYSYNGNMKNDAVTLPDGHTIRYEFDGEDRTVKVIDQLNNATNITYDNAGRVLSKRLPDGALVQYEYDKVGNVVKETNPKGASVTKAYDANGNVVSVKDSAGNITRYQYNAMSKVVRAVNAVSGTALFEYSLAGDLLSETDALGNKKTYTYDAFGNRLTYTDAMGNVTFYTYDSNNNLLTVKDALNNVSTYTYNALNQLISVKDAKNNVTRYGYDVLGRRTTVTDAKNNVFTTVYDANGNVIKTVDAKGNTVSETAYNSLNLPISVTDAAGKTTAYSYNALGKVSSVTDSLNNRQEYAYNSRGQNTGVTDAAGNLSTAVYDTLGNVTKLSGPLGGYTNYTYDSMGRLTGETTASGGTVSYGYNELNVKEKVTNSRGQVRKYFYDAAGRITGYVGAEDSVSYTYDANGNVLTVTDKNGSVKREYDALNRITKYTDTYGKIIRYEYDSVGNLTKIIYPDNTAVIYAYDANGNLLSVTDWANRVTSYTYDVNNRVVGVTKPDGSVTTTVYDNKNRIISTVEKTISGAIISGFEYVYDSLDRITEEKHLAKNQKMCYTYDSLSRVTARTVKDLNGNVLSTDGFSYDAAGNLLGTSALINPRVYDTNNRLTKYNFKDIDYDADGNMLTLPVGDELVDCVYDSANRLIRSGENTYTYNAEDVRIRNLCADEDTVYTYNTNCKLSKLLCKTTNGVVTKYIYGRGLIGEEVNNSFKTYHFDFRGSTAAVTDASGNITDTFEYDTYGKQISHTGERNIIFGYNGRDGVVTDNNGLIYMRARYYSPEIRRFINADIIPGEITNAITLNRYAYANGNPVSNIDPFGLSAERGVSSKDKETESYWIMAVLVTDFSLPVVGHSEIYFMNSYGEWLFTEYNTNVSIKDFGIKGAKGGAQVFYKTSNVDVSDFYNKDTGKFIKNPKGINYVVLEGNFNKSVALAKYYYDNQDFGRYNLFFNNCADYTNELLDVANIDGMSSQVLSEGNTLITIPVLREFELSISDTVDSGIEWVSRGLIDLGNSMKSSNIIGDVFGNVLIGTGTFIDGATNFVGDAVDVVTGVAGEFVDGAKDVAAKVTNAIADGAQAAWDFISFWD